MNMNGKYSNTKLTDKEIEYRMNKAWGENRIDNFISQHLISDIVPLFLLIGLLGFTLLIA